jgi:endoglucanase
VTYTYQSAPTFDYFGARGLPFIRLEVLWERLQPTPGGPLAPGNPNDNLGYLKQDIAWAKAAGAQISIDVHNYGRYTLAGSQSPCIIDNPCNGSSVLVSGADLADFWSKMAAVFVDEPTVVAYDIMNEPHDMGVANWNRISQEVVSAIRAVDPNKLIMIPGDGWSSATFWASYNGATSWISDPGSNFWYEGHEYFDFNYSGEYTESYDTELVANPDLANVGVTRLAPFVQWCTTNNVKCYVGEYGIPNAGPAADGAIPDARWLTVLDNFLTALDQAGLPGTYWAAGEWWGEYPLSVQPGGNFTTDAEQLQTLMNHLQPDLLRSTSAAASYGYAEAPNSWVAGYGNGLAAGLLSAPPGEPLSTKLGDTQVQVTDSAGTVSLAQLLFVSGHQVNYLLPSGVASGLAKVSVLDKGAAVSNGILQVQPTAPGMISMNSNGQGVAAAYIQRVLPDGTLPPLELVAVYSTTQGQWVAAPISFNGDKLILELFGTGFDNATTSNTNVTVNSTPVTVNYAGVQPTYVGEDQINVQLPSSLAGSGEVPVQVTVNDVTANTVTITFQ